MLNLFEQASDPLQNDGALDTNEEARHIPMGGQAAKMFVSSVVRKPRKVYFPPSLEKLRREAKRSTVCLVPVTRK